MWFRIINVVVNKLFILNIFLINIKIIIISYILKPLKLFILRANDKHLYTTIVNYGINITNLY